MTEARGLSNNSGQESPRAAHLDTYEAREARDRMRPLKEAWQAGKMTAAQKSDMAYELKRLQDENGLKLYSPQQVEEVLGGSRQNPFYIGDEEDQQEGAVVGGGEVRTSVVDSATGGIPEDAVGAGAGKGESSLTPPKTTGEDTGAGRVGDVGRGGKTEGGGTTKVSRPHHSTYLGPHIIRGENVTSDPEGKLIEVPKSPPRPLPPHTPSPELKSALDAMRPRPKEPPAPGK